MSEKKNKPFVSEVPLPTVVDRIGELQRISRWEVWQGYNDTTRFAVRLGAARANGHMATTVNDQTAVSLCIERVLLRGNPVFVGMAVLWLLSLLFTVLSGGTFTLIMHVTFIGFLLNMAYVVITDLSARDRLLKKLSGVFDIDLAEMV